MPWSSSAPLVTWRTRKSFLSLQAMTQHGVSGHARDRRGQGGLDGRSIARASPGEPQGARTAASTKRRSPSSPRRLKYVDGDYNDPATYQNLKEQLGAAERPLHYLAIPPSLFERVAEGLAKASCTQNARVVVEKPFGRDLASAQRAESHPAQVLR